MTGLFTEKTSYAGLAGLKVLVVGLGVTGLSAARFLAERGARVAATDLRPLEEIDPAGELADLGVTVWAGGGAVDLSGVDLVVTSPGVPAKSPVLAAARSRGLEVISDIELAWRLADVPFVAVTGTNGKSTTTALAGHILEGAGMEVFVGGNIGTPVLDLLSLDPAPQVAVVEVSSFHLESIGDFQPRTGVLLNITEDHLSRYRDFDHYAETKMRLFSNQGPEDNAVINADDPAITGRMAEVASRIMAFSTTRPVEGGLFLKDGCIFFDFNGLEEYPLEVLRLKGIQNIENAMAAIAASRLAGASPEAVARGLATFSGLAHRMEFVRHLNGVNYINDSKGTNTGALAMALRGLDGPIILIAGGRDKGGDYTRLRKAVSEKVKLLIVTGEAAGRLRDAFGDVVDVANASDMEEAVRKAHSAALEGDTVLLCPACSSFDMFRNFEERGECFRKIVEGLS